MGIEFWKGFVRREMTANINGQTRSFYISNERMHQLVGVLIKSPLGEDLRDGEIFDNTIMYYVPNNVFTLKDDGAIISYISNVIDSEIKLLK